MKHAQALIFILISILFCMSVQAQISEKERLSGFAEHQMKQKRFDEARNKGERAYLEEEEQWEHEKNRSLQEYKAAKKKAFVNDMGPAAKADAADKKAYEDEHELARRAYTEKRSRQQTVVRDSKNLPTEAQELGLHEERPRYDYSKRVLFGAQPKYGKAGPGGGLQGGGTRGGFTPGGTSFPPPPTFDDFGGGDTGYVPAPTMPEEFGDFPPPPPPPPMPMDDFGGSESMDFPPPPPPPPFGEEGGF